MIFYTLLHFILMVVLGSSDVPPPRDVNIVRSKLKWRSPSDDGVLYTLQYKLDSEPGEDWHTLSSHNGTKLRTFEITNEFYGATFRVRSEKGGNTSEWRLSNRVQCVHLYICIPLLTVNVKPGKTFLYMAHMDQSLEKEYRHIAFNISFWPVVHGGHSEKQYCVTSSKNEVFHNLKSKQTYCFEVQYLLFDQPYGNTSKQQCVLIPETPEEATRRTLLTTLLITLFILTVCGCCIFVLFKNHKRLKNLLRPPLEIPGHFREFLLLEYHQQSFPSSSIQSLQSCDVITLTDDVNMEENGKET